MADYTMRADGTAGSLAAALNGDPSVASECLSLAGHTSYGAGASAGDRFLLSDQGGDYHGILYTALSGSGVGTEITYANYPGESPYINGADQVSTWTPEGTANIWEATLVTQCHQVFIDGTYGRRRLNIGACTQEYDWYWSGGMLYLYATSDPDSAYTLIEASQRAEALYAVNRSYTIIDGITGGKCNGSALRCLTGSYITFRNCIAEWAWSHGFNATGGLNTAIVVEDCIARYCASQGVSYNNAAGFASCDVVRCQLYENGRHSSGYPSAPTFSGAMKIFCDGGNATNCTIEWNEVYSNGPAAGTAGSAHGNGLWMDYASGTSGNENHIRHNYCYDNGGCAVFLEASAYNLVYGNWGHDNAKNPNHGSDPDLDPATVRVDSRSTRTSDYNQINNNTFRDGRHGLLVLTYDEGVGCDMSNNVFKNNIFVETDNEALRCVRGGANDGTYGSSNVYDYNCFGAEASNFIEWGGTNYSTYDTYIAASSQGDHNWEDDPDFYDSGSDELWLATTDTGGIGTADSSVGATFDDGLDSTSSWPSSVVLVDRDDYQWDIGAYVYTFTPAAGLITVTVDANGKPIVWEATTQRITGSNGDVSDGDTIAIDLDGTDVNLFVNGVQIGSTYSSLTITTGTKFEMESVGADGTTDSVELFPKDVASKLPSELV